MEFRQIKHGSDLIDNHLEIIFLTDSTLSSKEEGRLELSSYSEDTGVSWLFGYDGGIQVRMYDLPPTHARNIARNETRVDAKGTSLNFRDKEFGTQFAIFRSRSLFKRLDI